MDRRNFLALSARTSQLLLGSAFLAACSDESTDPAMLAPSPMFSPAQPLSEFAARLASGGDLQAPDANGIRLPVGFSSRVVARSGEVPAGGSVGYSWHAAPDGGAVFATADGGWVYVSNSELANGAGGVGHCDSIRMPDSPTLTGCFRAAVETALAAKRPGVAGCPAKKWMMGRCGSVIPLGRQNPGHCLHLAASITKPWRLIRQPRNST